MGDTSLLRDSYHNESLLNEVEVDAYMVTICDGYSSIYDAGAIPEDFYNYKRKISINCL